MTLANMAFHLLKTAALLLAFSRRASLSRQYGCLRSPFFAHS